MKKFLLIFIKGSATLYPHYFSLLAQIKGHNVTIYVNNHSNEDLARHVVPKESVPEATVFMFLTCLIIDFLSLHGQTHFVQTVP